MKDTTYDTVTTVDEQTQRSGRPGSELYVVPKTLQLWFLLVTVYAVVAVCFAIWVFARCPTEGPALRALPDWKLNMNQFYSGLVLSLVFTPAALLTRRLANDVALLHPFALAFTTPIEINDLEVLTDPGLAALKCLFRYSKLRAFIQAVLMATGTLIVPVGTLLAYPGVYHKPRFQAIDVGMPIVDDGVPKMFADMKDTALSTFEVTATSIFRVDVISHLGISGTVSPELSIQNSSRFESYPGANYHGILAFNWSSGCNRTEDIQINFFNATDHEGGNATMPDGTAYTFSSLAGALKIAHITNPINGSVTTYFLSMDSVTVATDSVFFDNGTDFDVLEEVYDDYWWISRIACTPRLDWRLSTCQWFGDDYAECIPASAADLDWDPGNCNWNGTRIKYGCGGHISSKPPPLDTKGLDLLTSYMSNIPLRLAGEGETAFGRNIINMSLFFGEYQDLVPNEYMRPPRIQDYDNLYGHIAKALVSVATSGYYGSVSVPVTGYEIEQRYIIRIYILAIVLAMLVLSASLPMLVLLWSHRVHRIPIRSTTFFTIANAVRGSWWDETLSGTCLMRPTEMKDTLRGLKVKFGVTPVETTEEEHRDSNIDEHPPDYQRVQHRHVGFAPEVEPVREDVIYSGIFKGSSKGRGRVE